MLDYCDKMVTAWLDDTFNHEVPKKAFEKFIRFAEASSAEKRFSTVIGFDEIATDSIDELDT